MERWQIVWEQGLAPSLSTAGLRALRDALERDDPELLQGRSLVPPPLEPCSDLAVEGACAVGYCGWKGLGLHAVAEVELYFHRVCAEADERLNEPAACRKFFDWYDRTPRQAMRAWMLLAVSTVLLSRPVVRAA